MFNERRFLEAHDEIEAVWMACDGPERPLYQGLVQVAVACHHSSEGSWKGAVNVLRKARLKLMDLPSPMLGIDVAAVLGEIDRLQKESEAAARTGSGGLDASRFPRIEVR